MTPLRIAALILAALFVAEAVDAQPWGRRARKRSAPAVDLSPTCAIQTPSEQPAFTTTATSINLAGICGDDRGLGPVSWENVTTMAMGTAAGTTDWNVTASAGSAVTAQDQFGVLTNTALPDRSPNIGGVWTEAVDTGVDDTCQANAATNSVGPSTTRTNEYLICLLAPTAPISGADYTLSAKNANTVTASSGHVVSLIFAYQNATNFCSVSWYGTASGNDIRFLSRTADVVAQLGTSAVDVNVGDAVTVDVDGTTINVYVNGNLRVGPITSAFCATVDEVGISFGPLNGTAAHIQKDGVQIDDFTLTDRGASTAGVALNVGANTITVCALDTADPTPQEGCDTIIVTREASDTIKPIVVIQDPSSGATTTAIETISGIAGDNVGVTDIDASCPNCANVGAITGTVDWAFLVTLTCDGVTQNVITVTADDAAANVSDGVSITRTCTTADATPPTVVISTNSGNNFTTATQALSLAGTAADTGGSGLTQVTWTNSRGGSGTASGTSNWTVANITLAVGANVLTVQSRDGAGNLSTVDTITVTLSQALSISSSTLGSGVEGVAYTYCLAASGGTAPYTWTKTAGSYPAGSPAFALNASTGCITGTPTAAGTSAGLAFEVTDSAGMPDTESITGLSLVITAPGTGPDAFYSTTLLGRGDLWSNTNLRSQATINTLTRNGPNPYVTYCTPQPSCDTDAHAQNAAKAGIPFWATDTTTIASAMDASAEYWDCATTPIPGIACIRMTSTGNPSRFRPLRWIKVGTEIMEMTDPDGDGPLRVRVSIDGVVQNGFHVRRAVDGTSLASHSAASAFDINVNSMPLDYTLEVPLNSADGFTYFYTWDYMKTDSYMGVGFGGEKTWNFMCAIDNKGQGKICLEYGFSGQERVVTSEAACISPSASYNMATDVAALRIRNYHSSGGDPVWANTNGSTLGPGVFENGDNTCPMAVQPVFQPNTRYRFFMRVEQRANDYDYVTIWYASPTADAVKVIDNMPWSLDRNPNTGAIGFTLWWWEMNTSTDEPAANRIVNKQDYVSYMWWFVGLRQAGLVGATTLTDAALASAGLLARPQ